MLLRIEIMNGLVFAAQQAAEKAVKALYQKLGADARKLSRSVKIRYFDKKLQIQNNCKFH